MHKCMHVLGQAVIQKRGNEWQRQIRVILKKPIHPEREMCTRKQGSGPELISAVKQEFQLGPATSEQGRMW